MAAPHRSLRTTGVAVALLCVAVGGTARAQYDPIEDRDYTIDLHQGVVLGSIDIVGMAGAATSLAEGSVGMLANPASPAMRPATSSDTWDWDWHIDWLSPGLGSDFDNNGITTKEEPSVAPLLTAGLVIQYKKWAFGLNADIAKRRLILPDDSALEPSFAVGRFIVARDFGQFTAGLGVRTGAFTMTQVVDVPNKLFELTGGALEAGAIWHPGNRDLRVGVSTSLPVIGEEVVVEGCDPTDCQGFILPESVQVPWRVAMGASWRFGPTRWNRKVKGPWRDERYLLVAADLVLQGGVDNGHSVEGFVRQELQPSGRGISTSVRLGAEYEWLPGRLRVRGGTYYEPGRIPGVSGRMHATLGADLRFYSFCFLGDRYRARFSLTADIAERYGNTGVSIGLWH